MSHLSNRHHAQLRLAQIQEEMSQILRVFPELRFRRLRARAIRTASRARRIAGRRMPNAQSLITVEGFRAH
jgi:hypothetical protein